MSRLAHSFVFPMSPAILPSDLQKPKPMNLLKKFVDVAFISLSTISPRQIRYGITRKEWADLGLVLMVSVLIVIYKINKA
jgi:hypothetical protein